MRDVSGDSEPNRRRNWFKRLAEPWWAWIGVLAVTTFGLASRGLDFSTSSDAALTLLTIAGALLSACILLARALTSREHNRRQR